MTYELIGSPSIETQYSDEWETTMVCTVQREDGVEGDVWIVAGVPDCQRGSSEAARTQVGYCTVRVFGDYIDTWCPDSLRVKDEDGSYATLCDEILSAVAPDALPIHRDRVRARRDAIEFVNEHSDDDEMSDDELETAFIGLYERKPTRRDRETGLWSLLCAGVAA